MPKDKYRELFNKDVYADECCMQPGASYSDEYVKWLEGLVKNTQHSKRYIKWLRKRIEKTEKQLSEATELNLKIGKGAKLCVYKECLSYIIKHQ